MEVRQRRVYAAIREAHEENGYPIEPICALLYPIKEQWYLEKRNAICMTGGRVSPCLRSPPLRTWRWILRAQPPAVRSGSTGERLTSFA